FTRLPSWLVGKRSELFGLPELSPFQKVFMYWTLDFFYRQPTTIVCC
ncbi:hypothetical protein PSYMO_40125, partial [Pseudomonas amygdali pv. mori str. 301020]